ncbi:MAG: P22 coat protein - protein 5 domain protein [Anaerolineae bacterium]|nr:P22 coat protein - protein 5 domain protein [Anaerolineae bacterium]
MAITSFIPTVWAATLLAALDSALVYAQDGVCNRDYDGDVRGVGDKVKINSIGDVTIKTYSKNADIDAPQELTATQQELILSQAHYFNFAVDDVERAQSKPDVLQEAMRRAAFGLRNTADSYVAGVMTAGVDEDNTIGTTVSPIADLGTLGNAYNYLVDLAVLLDNADTPDFGRFVIVPPWFHGLLLKDDRFIHSGSDHSAELLRNGQVGEAAGFRILKSNNVPNDDGEAYQILAGHSVATSYVEQILEVEAFRPERRFSDAIKGLHVYGAKVVRGTNLAMLIADMPA